MSIIDHFPVSPRIFTDERLYNISAEHFKLFCYVSFGIQSAAFGKIGIHRIGRGEIAGGANIDMKRTEEIIEYFNNEQPDLMRYDKENHMIYLPSKLKYLIRSGYLKGKYIFAEVHRDFLKYYLKAPLFFKDFVDLYEPIIKESFSNLSQKDNNYPYYLKTYTQLFVGEELSLKKIKKDVFKESLFL